MRSLALFLGTAIIMVGLLIAAGDPRSAGEDATKDSDEHAIRALLHDLGEAWNKHEIKEFTARLGRERRRRQSVWSMDERSSRDLRALDRAS